MGKTFHGMLNAAQLRQRGWTETLIRRYLGEPDQRVTRYLYATQVRLFALSRVEEAEARADFQADRERAIQHKLAAARAVETKRRKMAEHLAALRAEVPVLDRDELVARACEHYNSRKYNQWERRGYSDDFYFREATPDSDPTFLERICVNYLRHALSDYERQLEQVAGKVGVACAYESISSTVYNAISAAHPWLAEECERQMVSKFGAGAESAA